MQFLIIAGDSNDPVDEHFSQNSGFFRIPPTGPPDVGQTILYLEALTSTTTSSLGVPSGMKQTYPGNIYRGGS
jgi:hypothetical protein